MFQIAWSRLATITFLGFLPFSILWKGGKSLETTWLLVAVAWLCTLTTWRNRSSKDNALSTPATIWVPLILFLLWTFISYLTSSTGNYGLDEVLRDSSLVLLFLWLLRESSREAYGLPLGVRVLQVLIVSTVIAAGIGALVYIFQPVPRFVGSFFDPRFHTDYWPNAWAELVLMVWPLVWLWPFRERWLVGSPALSLSNGLARWLVLGIILATLFLSYSRAAYIAFGVQILFWGFIHWKREGALTSWTWPRQSVGPVLVLLCFTAGTVLSLNALRAQFSPVQSAVEKITFTAAEGTSSITERQQFWKQSWQLLWEKPLFGFGPYSFRFVQTRLQEGVFATSDHPHNLFLKYAAERGLPAAVLFGVFLLVIILPTMRALVRNTFAPSPLLPLTLSITGVLFHLLLDFNLQFIGVALPLWLLLALLYRETPILSPLPAGASSSPPLSPTLLRFAEISLATALILLALFEGRFLLLSSLGRHAEARGDAPTALTWYERAHGEIFSRDLHLSRAHLSLLQKKPQDSLRALDDYLRVNRHDARAWKLLGDAHQKTGDFSAARTSYEEALRLGKWNHLGALRGLLDVLRSQGEKEVVTAGRGEFDVLLSAYLDAIERNTHFIALTPNVEEFLVITTTLAGLFPEDAPRYQTMGARVDRHAREERARLAARPVGRLW